MGPTVIDPLLPHLTSTIKHENLYVILIYYLSIRRKKLYIDHQDQKEFSFRKLGVGCIILTYYYSSY